MKAIALGKPVLAEKPVVTDFAQLDDIIQAAKAKGVLVFPAHNFVYRTAVLEAKKIIESGRLGRITYASFISTHTNSRGTCRRLARKAQYQCRRRINGQWPPPGYMSLYLMGMPAKIQAFRANILS